MSELVVGSIAGLAANSYVVDVASGSTLDLSAGAVFPAGTIIDVQSVTKTDVFSASVAAGSSTAVTGLSISHALKSASNKLLIMAFFGSAGTSHQYGNVGIAINDGTAFLSLGNAAGSRTRVTAGGWISSGVANHNVTMPHITIAHSPGTTDSKTYTIHAINIDTSTRTLYVNQQEGDGTDTAQKQRSASALHILEIAG